MPISFFTFFVTKFVGNDVVLDTSELKFFSRYHLLFVHFFLRISSKTRKSDFAKQILTIWKWFSFFPTFAQTFPNPMKSKNFLNNSKSFSFLCISKNFQVEWNIFLENIFCNDSRNGFATNRLDHPFTLRKNSFDFGRLQNAYSTRPRAKYPDFSSFAPQKHSSFWRSTENSIVASISPWSDKKVGVIFSWITCSEKW